MESGVDFSDGVKIWGDFSWISAIDAAASVSVMLSMLAIAGLSFSLLFIPFQGLWLLAKGKNGKALRAMLFAPGGLAVFYAAMAIGPYALLGLWTGLAIAGSTYAVARRLTLWKLARRFPEAVEALGYDRRFRKIFFQSGRRVRWMFADLGETAEDEAPALGVAGIAKLKASV